MIEFAEWLQATALSVTIQSVSWVIPLLQSIHILTIAVVFVSMLIVALRVLGRMRTDQTFEEVWARFGPRVWIGLAVMAVTGALLIIGEPVREFTSTSFWLKMALLVVAIASASAFARSLGASAHALPAGGEFSASAKAAAVGVLLLWIAIIFLGRAIAYDVEVWGSLSLTQHV